MSRGHLGKRIRDARKSLNMTQKDLAGNFITRNMLSQIENDQASPSLKTMEYIASKLDRPLGYFMDEEQQQEPSPKREEHIFAVLGDYNEERYSSVITKIEGMLEEKPILNQNQLLREVLMNAYFKYGRQCRLMGQFDAGIRSLEKLCQYKSSLVFDNMHLYYGALMELSEMYILNNNHEKGEALLKEAESLLERQRQSKEVQELLGGLYDTDPQKIIDRAGRIHIQALDPYQKAKYYYILATAQKSQKDFRTALKNYQMVVKTVTDRKYAVLLKLTLEAMSDCFAQIGDYKNAYEMMQKAGKLY